MSGIENTCPLISRTLHAEGQRSELLKLTWNPISFFHYVHDYISLGDQAGSVFCSSPFWQANEENTTWWWSLLIFFHLTNMRSIPFYIYKLPPWLWRLFPHASKTNMWLCFSLYLTVSLWGLSFCQIPWRTAKQANGNVEHAAEGLWQKSE